MKKSKRIVSILSAFALVILSVSIPANAASKTKLVTKKMNLKVGQSKKITIKGKKKKAKYTFTSSSKKKAPVSKSGVVKAKKTGTVTITVKEKYKNKTKKLGKVKVVIKAKNSVNNSTPTTPTTPSTPTVPATDTPTAPTPTATPAPTEEPAANTLDLEVPTGFRTKKTANAGTVQDISYESTAIVEGKTVTRKAKVVLPKGYTKEKKYPVLYMIHGIFGDENSLYSEGTQNVIWNAIANGDANEMIVVFPNACANEEGKGEGYNLEHYQAYNNFTNDLSTSLMPYINANYSTLTGRENTAICGFSMGGRVSLQIGFQKQEDFRYVGAFCPAFGIFEYTNYGVTEPGFFTEDTFTLKKEFIKDTLVLIAAGPNDDIVKTEPKRYANALEKNKVPHIYYETMGGDSANAGGGGHEAAVYQHGLYNFLKRVFKEKLDVPSIGDDPGNDPEQVSLDMSTADIAVIDGAGTTAEANSETGCIDLSLGQFQGVVFKNTTTPDDFKKVTITYKADSEIKAYIFDENITDGLGQNAAGQTEVNPLAATDDSFQTVTYDIANISDYSGSCVSAIKLVHIDFNNSSPKNVQIQSIVFSK